jgi:hypothetical protein
MEGPTEWKQEYYELKQIPDLTLSKYSQLDEGDVEGVLKQHQAFWRQMNRRGRLLNEGYQLIYEYDPERELGNRLRICFRVDTCIPSFMEETLRSSAIGAYFELDKIGGKACKNEKEEALEKKREEENARMASRRYRYAAHLIKKERVMRSLNQTDGQKFYIVSSWEMNETARLYSMMKLMSAINRPCVYCVNILPTDQTQEMRQNLEQILSFLRRTTQLRVNKSATSVSANEKDENAKDTLDLYEDLLEDLDTTPHFLTDVEVLADDSNLAQYILDAAASEALSEGSHEIRTYEENCSLADVSPLNIISCAGADAPEKLKLLPHLMLLPELSAFAVFPALYAGEFIDAPKETLPTLYAEGLLLGRDNEGHDVRFPLKNLSKHAFLAGVPGSGKTNSMMHLITSMHVKYQIPVLILEPAKHEYRILTAVPGMEDLELFSPSANTPFPLHINPFEFPVGMTLAEHIRNLIDVFDGAFTLDPPMPFLLDSSVEEVYRDHNWLPSMVNRPDLGFTYPTLSELYDKVADKLEHTDYEAEIKGNLKSVLQVRIGSLLTREMGDVFNVSHSTLPPEAWLKRSAVIELESMGKYPANFLSLLLSTLIRETLKVQDYNKLPDGRPRHVMFFEEAHNLIGPTAEQSADGNTDTKTAATAFVVKMLAEVRALGEGIVIADQLPTAMAPEVIKNTSLKIGLRITAQDDRGLLGGTMSADEVQLERMGVFSPGHALCSYEPLLKPFEVQIPYFESKEDNAETVTIVRNLLSSPYYQEDLRQSLEIHRDGWKRQRYEIRKKYNEMLAKGRNSDPIGSKESAKKAQDVRAQRDEVVKKVQQVFLDVAAYGSMLQVVFHEAKVKPDLGECKTIFDNIKKTLKSEREIAWNQYNQIYKALEPTNLRITEEEDTALSIRAKAF